MLIPLFFPVSTIYLTLRSHSSLYPNHHNKGIHQGPQPWHMLAVFPMLEEFQVVFRASLESHCSSCIATEALSPSHHCVYVHTPVHYAYMCSGAHICKEACTHLCIWLKRSEVDRRSSPQLLLCVVLRQALLVNIAG